MAKKVVEASTIGLKPGQFPTRLQFAKQEWTFLQYEYHDDEVVAAIYTSGDDRLHVLND